MARTKRKAVSDVPEIIINTSEPLQGDVVTHQLEILELSQDGRRTRTSHAFDLRRAHSLERPGMTVSATLNNEIDVIDYATSGNFDYSDFGLVPFLGGDEPDLFVPAGSNAGRRTKRTRAEGGWDPLKQWAENSRSDFLDEVLRLEGRGDYPTDQLCFACNAEPSIYRCIDCEMAELFCAQCLVKKHALSPLHCIKKWNGKFFERETLKNLGLRVQLGHPAYESCTNPKCAPGKTFTVVHSNGIHEINLDFCNCETAQSPTTQLLRRHWYPATSLHPHSATTIRVLKSFHLLAFEGKCSPFEFYNSLARATDNTGIYHTKDRYEEFMRVYRQWCNITMAKRAGRAHDQGGLEGTSPGECAILCPACPQPGKNLPSNWEDAPPEKSWLYSLFVAIDANFRLVRKEISSEELDPSLSDGWAFFVKTRPYREYLTANWAEPQPRSTCVNHEAVNNPDKAVKGKSVSGGGTADCARHNMKRPCGFADLQKGERYLNMDYLVFSSLKGRAVKRLVLSYDIACQWHKNIWDRMATVIPKSIWLDKVVKHTTFLVPKFHLPAHIAECNLNFSFNHAKHVGRTDGEAPERGWSRTNALATSTREMGPGFRRDTLDDHFNDWNWKKVTGMGASLWKKLQNAVPEAKQQRIDFKEYEATLSEEQKSRFKAMVEKWEVNITEPNPYKPTVKHITMAEVKLAFAKEAAREAATDTATINSNMHPTEFIAQGIQLEDQQHRLRRDFDKLKSASTATPDQLRAWQESANRLCRRINIWLRIQATYIPSLAVLREADDNAAIVANNGIQPEVVVQDIKLYLPSSLPPAMCSDRFNEYEWKLREAEAYTALYDIRYQFRIQAHWMGLKQRFHRGVSDNTRSNSTLNDVTKKITFHTQKYHHARRALLNLCDRPGIDKVRAANWQDNLQVLKADDVRGLSEGGYRENDGKKKKEKESEGAKTISWIWKLEGAQDGPPDEELQIAWCKSRARSMRWLEEVDLLREEMRRVLEFLEWQAQWWRQKGGTLMHVSDPATRSGMIAYRERQATLREDLKARFKCFWEGSDALVSTLSAEGAGNTLGVDRRDVLST